jgi:TetR/AcrR family transcriptional repressor of nem operon
VVAATSRLLRERGAAETSVQEAMSAAGLTHGGFYKHFGSKSELIALAAGSAFGDIEDTVDRISTDSPDAPTARKRVLDDYLTIEHRDAPGTGCANTALAADASRTDDPALRAAYVDGLRRTLARLESIEPGPEAHMRAVADLVVLVGGLTLARATAGDPISEEVLAIARGLLDP